jgi:DNA-binding LytR/AlgR family response regulator
VQYSYLIIDDDQANIKETLHKFEGFPEFFCAGTATNKDDAINQILELQPQLVLLEINPANKKSNLSLAVITDLYQYTDVLPYFIIHTATTKFAFEAIKAGAYDYLLKPLSPFELRKSLLRFQKTNPASPKNTICIKSYGDYQFISLTDIVYLKADNNTTDFFLQSGRKITAYKTLKHYETSLPLHFFRIHNSYIVNSNYISRINTGKSLCYLNNSDLSISFSKTFKDNIDSIIKKIAPDY